MLRIFIIAVVVLGSGAYLYFYQFWPRRHDHAGSIRIKADRSFPIFYRYLQISTPCYAAYCVAHPYLPWREWVAWNGLSVSVGAILLFIWSMLSLRDQYSHCFDSFVSNSLVARGPYALIRHPIYVANCLMLAGLFFATASWGVLVNAGILGVFYYRAACREEAALMRHLPGYRQYIGETGRFLPRLRRSSISEPLGRRPREQARAA